MFSQAPEDCASATTPLYAAKCGFPSHMRYTSASPAFPAPSVKERDQRADEE